MFAGNAVINNQKYVFNGELNPVRLLDKAGVGNKITGFAIIAIIIIINAYY